MARKLPLPRGWKRRVRSAVLHILALSRYWFTPFSAGTTFAGAGLPPAGTTDLCTAHVACYPFRVPPVAVALRGAAGLPRIAACCRLPDRAVTRASVVPRPIRPR